ncbi:MAG: MFS transporter [Rhodobacteraceae bacterium]|nr:MFS transporter [Paracoccaceae bacterium]
MTGATAEVDQPGDAPAVWLLALGQTLGFATLLYMFGALIVPLEQATGWSKAALSLGPTTALVVSAMAAPFMGRLVDKGFGAELLSGGAMLGGIAVAGLSLVTSQIGWIAVWAVVGLAHSASLYDVCFAFLTRRLGVGARAAIIRATLLAGFASTIAFPAGAILSAHFGWTGAVLVFGAVQVLVTAPVNWYAGFRLRRRERVGQQPTPTPPGMLSKAVRKPQFWLLVAVFALCWMNHAVFFTYFIPIFTELGAPPGVAVAAAACVGPAQFAGRLLLMFYESRFTAHGATAVAIVMFVVASLVLLAPGASIWLIFAFALLQGSGIGLMSILRPVLIAEVMGREGFGAIAGAIAMGPLLAIAAAPLVGAGLLGLGGAKALIAGALAMAVTATVLAAVLRRVR